jgi:hypothetical protein
MNPLKTTRSIMYVTLILGLELAVLVYLERRGLPNQPATLMPSFLMANWFLAAFNVRPKAEKKDRAFVKLLATYMLTTFLVIVLELALLSYVLSLWAPHRLNADLAMIFLATLFMLNYVLTLAFSARLNAAIKARPYAEISPTPNSK